MGSIFYTKQFCKKTFIGSSVKDAYLRACKWYATNVISNENLHGVFVEYKKEKNRNAVTIMLYTATTESEILDRHCACCREMHHSFFINEETNCDKCSVIGFSRRLEKSIAEKVKYCKGIINKTIER